MMCMKGHVEQSESCSLPRMILAFLLTREHGTKEPANLSLCVAHNPICTLHPTSGKLINAA